MNCLEYRRLMHTVPGEAGAAARSHAQACPACAALGRRLDALECVLEGAARIPVPENLRAGILMRQAFKHPSQRRRRALPALAAALVLGVAAVLYGAGKGSDEAGLQAELVALVEAADYALEARGPVREQAVEQALGPVGLAVRQRLGAVSFAGRCLVRGNLSGHLVLRETTVPVTVFLMPRERVARLSRFRRAGWRGMLVPAEQGTVGFLVPADGAVDQDLVERVVGAVRWPT